jgi:hypothetical protein
MCYGLLIFGRITLIGFTLIFGFITTGGLVCLRALGTAMMSGFLGSCLGLGFSLVSGFCLLSSCSWSFFPSFIGIVAQSNNGAAKIKIAINNDLKMNGLSIM